jgi:hypothetical protein
MMKYGKKFVAMVAIGLAVLSFAPTAMAAEEEAEQAEKDGGPRLGLFAGLDVGFAAHDGSDAGLADTDQVAWGMNAWFRPSRFGAIQMGYSDLGDDLNGFHSKGMAMYPLGVQGVSLFGSVGVLIETGNDSDTDTWLTYGGGVIWDQLKIGKVDNLGLRLDYERYDETNNSDNVADRITVGFFYRFGHMGDKK